MRIKMLIIAGLLLITAGCAAMVRVEPQTVAVVTNRITGELEDPLGPGLHLVGPFREITVYDTGPWEYTLAGLPDEDNPTPAVPVQLMDGEEVLIDVTIFFAIDPQEANTLHQNLGNDYWDFIDNAIRNTMTEVATTYTARDLYGEGRSRYGQDVKEQLRAIMATEGLELIDSRLRQVDFSAEFSRMIEEEALATQRAVRTAAADPTIPDGFGPFETINPALTTDVTTALETDEQDIFFIVQNNQIHYGYSYTLDCQYVIAGEIFDLNGDPITEDVVVTLDMLELEGDVPEYSFSFPGNSTERGPSGWAAVVVNWDVDYMVWLTRLSTNERISPQVFVQTQDCENNLAVINFIQVAPLK